MIKHDPLRIGERHAGTGHPCFIIAEIGLAHYGVLGLAHAYIDLAAQAGADAVKFQTHLPACESSTEESFRVPISSQYQSRPEYWAKTSFTADQWAELAAHSRQAGLVFMSTPFSEEAIAMLAKIGQDIWKVASGEVCNPPLLRTMAATGKPILLSSGMSPWLELDAATSLLEGMRSAFAVLQCTSKYPVAPAEVGFNVMAEIRHRYGCLTGLSDHSGQAAIGIAAVAQGASFVECHLTFDKHIFGPDVAASLTGPDFTRMTQGIRAVEESLAHPLSKDAIADHLDPVRKLFTKSIGAARPLSAGTPLSSDGIRALKPGTGIPISELNTVMGRILKVPKKTGELIRWQDLANA